MERFSGNPRPIAVGTDFLHGNELNLFERRMAPLTFMEPYFLQRGILNRFVDKEPLRLSQHMTEIRSDEMTGFSKRRQKDTRKMKHEFTDRIQAIIDKQKREEEEARKIKRNKQARWWQRSREPDKAEPLKYIRYTNLTMVPENLLMMKDIVTLQLTGARLGDASMTWIGGFLNQSKTVKRLVLQGNYITEDGVQNIVDGLRATKCLMELDLSLNPIGDAGVELVCNALLENSKHSRVYLLNVSTCELTSASGFHLGRFIREFTHLQCLLAWRNRLGIADGAPISGAGLMLDELGKVTHMRVLHLGANNITDTEASNFAASLERVTRRKILQQMEKAQGQKRIDALLLEVEERKKRMVGRNMDEKIAIHRLERQAEQEKNKQQMAAKLVERQRTYAERQELEYEVRVKLGTGQELIKNPFRCRLLLGGNALTRQTTNRLAKYYSLEDHPDVDDFIARPRRFDNIIVPKRQVGEAYVYRDGDVEMDPHNVMPFDAYDPQLNYDRRHALIQQREDDRIKAEEMVLADFNKFAVRDIGKLPPEERAKASSGFSLASGVNSRVKLVRDPAKALVQKLDEEHEEDNRVARIRSNYGLKPDGSPVMSRTPTYQARRIKDESYLGDMSPRGDPGASITVGVSAEPSTATHQPTIAPAPPQAAAEENFLVDATTGEVWRELELDEGELMQAKLEERMKELRHHVVEKQQSLYRQRSNVGDKKQTAQTGQPLKPADSDAFGAEVSEAQATSGVREEGSEALQEIMTAVQFVRDQWEVVRELGEIGSPSDSDLRRLEEAKSELSKRKLAVSRLMEALPPAANSTITLVEGSVEANVFEQFLEDLVKETDTAPGNTECVLAIVDHIPINLGQVLADRGLVAMAASDSSESFFTKFLSQPNPKWDVSEVCAACFYNQSHRIPLTFIAIQFVDLAPYEDEIGEMLREFFGDIASDRRAIPRESRTCKMMLLRSLLAMQWLNIDVEAEGADGHSIFTRALYEGDVDVIDMILEDPTRIKDINKQLDGNNTPLIHAVLGNSVPLVTRLLKEFPTIDVSFRSSNGNAVDLAIGLSRDSRIVALLREYGAQPSGAKVDKAAAAPKKIKMKVKVEAPAKATGKPSASGPSKKK